jgi:streptomycin 6-kinase
MSFAENLYALYPGQAKDWLAALPAFLKSIETKLSIHIAAPFSNLTYHYVAPATSATGEALIFKCGIPQPEMRTEIAALQHYNGQGCVRLIASDVEQGWLLLEACQPGVMLSTLEDDEAATHHAVEVMQKLWKPIAKEASFPNIENWLEGLSRMQQDPRAKDLISKRLMDYSIGLSKDLCVSMGELVLLHGDLHHDNILSSNRAPYLAIDPKGLIGEREYECGALVRNPICKMRGMSGLSRFLKKRLDQIAAETGFDRKRIQQWSMVQAVLAAYWQIEDGEENSHEWIQCAEALV